MRMIWDGAHAAADNMGRDEALLETTIATGVGAMRFYTWSPPAVSLGYFQPADDWASRRNELEPFDLVRRPTGGGAILHADELTYSLTVRDDLNAIDRRPNHLYRIAHEIIREALQSRGVGAEFFAGEPEGNSQRGPFFCFARRHRYDLVVGEGKVAGSAQRRRGGAILQHGSIILGRTEPQPSAAANEHAGKPIDPAELAGQLAGPLADALGATLENAKLTDDELDAARHFAVRYRSDEWMQRR